MLVCVYELVLSVLLYARRRPWSMEGLEVTTLSSLSWSKVPSHTLAHLLHKTLLRLSFVCLPYISLFGSVRWNTYETSALIRMPHGQR